MTVMDRAKCLGTFCAAVCLAGCGSQTRISPSNMLPALKPASSAAAQTHRRQTRYTVVYTGTFGGSYANPFGINQAGMVSGSSWLPGDTNYHAYLWNGHRLKDIGTLGGPDSETTEINDVGIVVGFAETATADPLGEDFCATGNHLVCSATIWHDGKIIALPTFGGNNAYAQSNNDRDQTVGVAETAEHDKTCAPPQVLRSQAAVWTGTHKPRTLPPYKGDPDTWALAINERGTIVGQSGPCSGSHVRVVMWRNGAVIDLGSLGGSYGQPFHINDRDQVVGNSNLTGNKTSHAFLWENGKMHDLSPLTGDAFSAAWGMDEAGHAVGASWSPDKKHFPLNYSAVIWQQGAVIDLNTVVPPYSLRLLTANKINDRGEIIGLAYDSLTGKYPGFVAFPNH